VLAGFGIFARNQLARWFGVAVAAVNLIAALTSIEAYRSGRSSSSASTSS